VPEASRGPAAVPRGAAGPADLGARTWPEVARSNGSVLAVAVGSVEQHGPHLPLDTDLQVAQALVRALAVRRPAVVAGPPVAYGASGEHAGFPGTVSIGHWVLEHLVVELVRSATATFRGVVVVSGHGGNEQALARAAARCRVEGRPLLVWPVRVPGGDAHAGRTETSLMLALDPEAVRTGEVVRGRTEPLAVLLADLRRHGMLAVSPSGVLGDPRHASAAEGEHLLEMLVSSLVADVDRWWRDAVERTGPAGETVRPALAGEPR